jgi:GntR family transcriptional regulator
MRGSGESVPIDPSQPRSVRVADELRQEIRAGRYRPGEPLPSERELRDRFGVSNNTIRSALVQLRSEGIVTTYHGRGTFAREQTTPRKLGGDMSWRAILARYGKTDASVITVRREPCPQDAAERLGIDAGTVVLVRDRLLRAEGEPPAMISLSWHPDWIVEQIPDLADPAKGGMKGLHEALGLRLHFLDVFSSRQPTDAERERLELQPGDVVTDERGATYDQDDRPLYAIHHVAPGHRIELAVTYGDMPGDTA